MNSPIYLLLLLLFFLTACTSDKPEEESFDTEKALELLKEDIEKGTYFYEKRRVLGMLDMILEKDSTYFTNEVWPDTNYIDPNKIIRKALEAKDFTQYSIADSVEAYRLEVDRSFNDEKIYITAENKNGVKKLIIQSYYADRECSPYTGSKDFDKSCVHIIKNKVKPLNNEEWGKIVALTMPYSPRLG